MLTDTGCWGYHCRREQTPLCVRSRLALSPRRLCLFNTTTGAPLQELNFLTSVLAVRLNKLRSLCIFP